MRALAAFAVVCAATLALGGVSQAAQMSSPTIFGAGDQSSAECSVLNAGTGTLSLTITIIDDFAQTTATRNCGPVGAGQFCSLFTPIDNAEAHACLVATSSSITNLRGSLVLFRDVIDDFGLKQLESIRVAPLR